MILLYSVTTQSAKTLICPSFLLLKWHVQHPPFGGEWKGSPDAEQQLPRGSWGRGVGWGFEDPTSPETNLLSGLTPGDKVPWAHQAEGRSRLGARSAPAPPARRLHHLRRPGEQGPSCRPRPGPASRAPLGCSLPPDPSVRPASRRAPVSVVTDSPITTHPARGLGSPHLHPESRYSARATLKVFFNQRRPRLRGLTPPAAPARPCLPPPRVSAVVSHRGRAPRGCVRRGTAGANQHRQLSGSVCARALQSPARRCRGRRWTPGGRSLGESHLCS